MSPTLIVDLMLFVRPCTKIQALQIYDVAPFITHMTTQEGMYGFFFVLRIHMLHTL